MNVTDYSKMSDAELSRAHEGDASETDAATILDEMLRRRLPVKLRIAPAKARSFLPAATAPEELTDAELRAAYLATSQEVGDAEVERLIPEMQHRDIEF